MHRNIKIKDHAEAAIGNLNIRTNASLRDSMRSNSNVSSHGNGDRRASGHFPKLQAPNPTPLICCTFA